MTDNETERVILPTDLVSVTPKPDTLSITYRHVNGHDLLAIFCDDARVGPVELMLTPSAAHYTAAHLVAMIECLDALREKFNRTENGND